MNFFYRSNDIENPDKNDLTKLKLKPIKDEVEPFEKEAWVEEEVPAEKEQKLRSKVRKSTFPSDLTIDGAISIEIWVGGW